MDVSEKLKKAEVKTKAWSKGEKFKGKKIVWKDRVCPSIDKEILSAILIE